MIHLPFPLSARRAPRESWENVGFSEWSGHGRE